ncbi:MAG: acyltransferase [Bacteroidales bacterium]|nr:acyltransferase [Bacteroidales bacterium]
MIKNIYNRIRNSIIKYKLKGRDNEFRIRYLRRKGVKIGDDCLIFTINFSTEPYLIKIGNHVVVSPGVTFITHDGSVWLFRDKYPNITVFGNITVGNNTFIGINCIILPGTEIGENCIIGAGSVVRGKIPDNSVVMGNPAKVVMKTEIAEKFLVNNKNRVDTKHMSPQERKMALLKHFGV